MFTVGSLFSGIGGWEIAAQNLGWQPLFFAEKNPVRRGILEKNFPGVDIFEDVSRVTLDSTPHRPNVICASFPCQDLSFAGRRAGINGRWSGLWAEVIRVVRAFEPDYLAVENVPGLRSAGMEHFLWSLAEIGFDAEWDCIPAAAVGAPHVRDRLWLVAYPNRFLSEGYCGTVFGTLGSHIERARALGWPSYPEDAGSSGVDDGFLIRVDRLAALGDSLVPRLAEAVLGAIEDYDSRRRLLTVENRTALIH